MIIIIMAEVLKYSTNFNIDELPFLWDKCIFLFQRKIFFSHSFQQFYYTQIWYKIWCRGI